jgi:hypothetical protein
MTTCRSTPLLTTSITQYYSSDQADPAIHATGPSMLHHMLVEVGMPAMLPSPKMDQGQDLPAWSANNTPARHPIHCTCLCDIPQSPLLAHNASCKQQLDGLVQPTRVLSISKEHSLCRLCLTGQEDTRHTLH